MPLGHTYVGGPTVIKPLPRSQVPDWFGHLGCNCTHVALTSVPVQVLGRMYVNKRVAESFQAVMRVIAESGKAQLIDKSDYGGTFICRHVGWDDSKPMSPHSWGIAVDINVHYFASDSGEEKRSRTNYRSDRDEIAPSLRELAAYFNAFGFSWGGDWTSVCDPMHYEATELTVKLLEGGLSGEEAAVIDGAREKVGLPSVGSTSGSYADGPVKVIIMRRRPGGGFDYIPLPGLLQSGHTYVALRDLCNELEFPASSLHDHILDQRKVYLEIPGTVDS